jgi:hypothetical protein
VLNESEGALLIGDGVGLSPPDELAVFAKLFFEGVFVGAVFGVEGEHEVAARVLGEALVNQRSVFGHALVEGDVFIHSWHDQNKVFALEVFVAFWEGELFPVLF